MSKQSELEALAAEAFRTKERFLMLGAQNIFGLPAEEREQITAKYAVAERQMIEAQHALDRAINRPQGALHDEP